MGEAATSRSWSHFLCNSSTINTFKSWYLHSKQIQRLQLRSRLLLSSVRKRQLTYSAYYAWSQCSSEPYPWLGKSFSNDPFNKCHNVRTLGESPLLTTQWLSKCCISSVNSTDLFSACFIIYASPINFSKVYFCLNGSETNAYVCKMYSICCREECASAHTEACLWPTSAAAWLQVSTTYSAQTLSGALMPYKYWQCVSGTTRSELSIRSKCSRGSGKGHRHREDSAESRSGQDSLIQPLSYQIIITDFCACQRQQFQSCFCL